MKLILVVFLMMTIATNADAKEKKKKPPAKPKMEKPCETIEDVTALATLNPYDNRGRCFYYMGRNIQLLDISGGLFSIGSGYRAFAALYFGKESAPMGFFQGPVRGYGAFTYETVEGASRTVHFMRALTDDEVKEIRERQEAKKKAVMTNTTTCNL